MLRSPSGQDEPHDAGASKNVWSVYDHCTCVAAGETGT
jgi:hypothetical protein